MENISWLFISFMLCSINKQMSKMESREREAEREREMKETEKQKQEMTIVIICHANSLRSWKLHRFIDCLMMYQTKIFEFEPGVWVCVLNDFWPKTYEKTLFFHCENFPLSPDARAHTHALHSRRFNLNMDRTACFKIFQPNWFYCSSNCSALLHSLNWIHAHLAIDGWKYQSVFIFESTRYDDLRHH